MRNLLIESKRIYSNKIINLIYIKIYEGFLSIYNDAKNVSNGANVLQLFQKFLKQIQTWDDVVLEREKLRIFGSNQDLITKILKLITKINLKILTNCNDEMDINSKTLNSFIHNVYKLVAIVIWDNPFLFYHDLEPEILKKNQREVYNIIKEAINRAMDELIDLSSIIDKCLLLDLDAEDKQMEELLTKINNIESRINSSNPQLQTGGNNLNISEILNNNNVKISDSHNIEKHTHTANTANTANHTAEPTITEVIQEKVEKQTEKTIDSKIENIIEKDLKMTEDDKSDKSEDKSDKSEDNSENNSEDNIDDKKSYKPEESEQYQEVFSNSEAKSVNSSKSLNSVQKGENLKRNKFFSNYLNF